MTELTLVDLIALANCQYPKHLRHLKCHSRGCNKRIDNRYNALHCYEHWRVSVKTERTEWQEFSGKDE